MKKKLKNHPFPLLSTSLPSWKTDIISYSHWTIFSLHFVNSLKFLLTSV